MHLVPMLLHCTGLAAQASVRWAACLQRLMLWLGLAGGLWWTLLHAAAMGEGEGARARAPSVVKTVFS